MSRDVVEKQAGENNLKKSGGVGGAPSDKATAVPARHTVQGSLLVPRDINTFLCSERKCKYKPTLGCYHATLWTLSAQQQPQLARQLLSKPLEVICKMLELGRIVPFRDF